MVLTNEQAVSYLDNLSYLLYRSKNIGVEFLETESVGNGDTIVSISDRKPCVVLGFSEWFDVVQYPYHEMDETDFVETIVAMCHENRHCDQHFAALYHTDALSTSLALEEFAQFENPTYVDDNYLCSSRELDAYLMGIHDAKCLCDDLFGKQKSERLLLAYVNKRVRSDDDFLQTGKIYTKLDDVYVDITKQLKQSFRNRFCYDLSKFRDIKQGDYLVNNSAYAFDRNPQFWDSFQKSRTGLSQNWKLAALCVNRDATNKQYAECYRSLHAIPLDLQSAFGVNFGQQIVRGVTEFGLSRKRNADLDARLERLSEIGFSPTDSLEDEFTDEEPGFGMFG